MIDNGGSSAGSVTVKIEIYDQSYNVNADGNEEDVYKRQDIGSDGKRTANTFSQVREVSLSQSVVEAVV